MVKTPSRFFRRATRIAVALVAAFVILLGATTVWHQAALAREATELPEYGRLVEVEGKQMNVVVSGNGPTTIVLVPGFGTAAPALDFGPLIAELSPSARVIAVEPFGYGLSDPTDTPRTAERIVTEIHSAVAGLGVQRYVLMGHSIGGIYGLTWAELFGDELIGFVGIDSSVPGQANMDTRFPTGLMAVARFTGVARIAAGLGGDGLDPALYDDETRRDMALLSNRNSFGPTYLDEMTHIASNFREARGTAFPPALPLLLFAQAGENPGQPEWIPLHEQQAASVEDGELVLLPGSHYLHHTHAAEIAAQTRAFLDARAT